MLRRVFPSLIVLAMMSLFLLAFWSFSPDEFSPRGPWKGPSASHRPAGETHKTFVETAKKEDPEIQNILIDSELARILQDQRKYNPHRENATFITLARNSDLRELMGTIRSIEDRFNHKYHYDWVFLNEEPFSQEFVNVTTHLISGTTKYGLVKSQHWSYPDWINQTLAEEARNDMKGQNIIYGDSESYRHMCRFESGFFFQHPLMLDYKYYWRVEPSTTIHCDIDYDVFRFMRSHNKKYGFTIALREFEATVHSLWAVTKNFISHYPHYIAKYNMIDFISDNSGESYNMCHYWSNFEVADMDFWRSKPYQDYFNYLDQAGGFFYERWGDAPIHSIAASLFLNSSEVHFFEDIGYTHPPFTHCPCNALERNLTCSCLPEQNFDWEGYSCLRNYYFAQEIPLPPGVDVY